MRRDARFGADARQEGLNRGEEIIQRHRAGLAGHRFIRHQIAGEIDDHGGMFAVRQLHPCHQMRCGAHAQGHGGPPTGRFDVAGGGDLFDQAGLDQLGADCGDGGGRDVQLARQCHARDQACGADPLKDLLTQRALGFRQRGNQRTHAFRPLPPCPAAAHLRHYFSLQRKLTRSRAVFALNSLHCGETGSFLMQGQLGPSNIF